MTALTGTNPTHFAVPVIDIGPLLRKTPERLTTAEAIGRACREVGFFYITGTGVDTALLLRLEHLSREFFSLSLNEKNKIQMSLGGSAWRGYFPLGDELTSGKPDLKEGIYFGAELDDHHLSVKANIPLHGKNLFPVSPPGLAETVLLYMKVMTKLSHAVMVGIALSLGLSEDFFESTYTQDPFILFRIFNYPEQISAQSADDFWGVGEHTDYGLLTILKQDNSGGLQVKTPTGWVDAPPIPDSFVCNIGDMLELMTGGLYRSTPHRVRNTAKNDRLSFPFFFDPGFDAVVKPILTPQTEAAFDARNSRWDNTNVYDFRGTYGQYILGKVAKVFPDLKKVALKN